MVCPNPRDTATNAPSSFLRCDPTHFVIVPMSSGVAIINARVQAVFVLDIIKSGILCLVAALYLVG